MADFCDTGAFAFLLADSSWALLNISRVTMAGWLFSTSHMGASPSFFAVVVRVTSLEVFFVPGTDPFDTSAANFPAIERAAFGTSNAARKRVDILCRGFGELFFSFFEKHLDFLKQVFFHDGSVGAGGVVHIFLATVLGLLEGHSRAAVGFLITAVSDISLIGEHIGDLGGFPFLFAVLCWHPTIRQILGNFRCGHSAKVCLEDPPYNISFRRVFHKLLVFEVETVGSIAVYIDAKLHSFDDGESLVLGDCLGLLS